MAGEMPRQPIGALIKRYREARRVTQGELAAAAGISVGALRDLEQGRTRFPRWGTVEELAATLGVGQAHRAELARAFVTVQPGIAGRTEAAGTRIDILGPLAASRDGTPVPLGPARQRAVLGLLALHAGGVVHREAIIDTLWGDRPPASAVTETQSYVSRLRKILGRSRELISTEGGRCYRLNVRPDQLDVARFEELTRQAREAAPARARNLYERALPLWRGDILADVDLLRDHPAAVAMTRRRSEAVLGYADAAGRAGAHARAVPYLRELCAAEPFNEPAHARLMVALAAGGEQAAALHIFTGLRRRLDEELGISPSSLLTEAHTQVLRQQLLAGDGALLDGLPLGRGD
jgi:DNA-binding SARP family transcriptional activator/DNA-binding XRE family transcriptional regulator